MPVDIRNTTPDDSPHFFKEYWENETGHFMHHVRYKFNEEAYQSPTKIITDVLWAEYYFRSMAQLKDNWNDELQRCHEKDKLKSPAELSHSSAVKKFDYAGFDKLHNACTNYERNLFLKESALPYGTLKLLYDSLREDPSWYLRKSLVEDCAAAGGCCARSCGCCTKRLRNLPRKGISGHCSLYCSCCTDNRGSVFGEEEQKEMHDQYKEALNSDNPFFFLRIASAYFAPLEKKNTCENQKDTLKSESSDTLIKNEKDYSTVSVEELTDDFEGVPPSYESHISDTNGTQDTTSSTNESSSFLRLRHAFPFSRI